MSYIALARKWRPRTFLELVGQDHINKALINSLNQNRLHHAYLFTGTRGVGKTSVARLLAKALNCELGISSVPCLKCDACIAIEQGRFIDLIEIDGASRTRVEDTREILENVQYAPTNGRFKIYLIDEVHMLSQHSFNALLKTLEEPPEHVKFILATTDPQKLPVTVLSRCLQFNLKNLESNVIAKQLELILNDEKLTYDIEAINILAHAARGSMRDALSLLDQAIAISDNSLDILNVKNILGYTKQNYAIELLKHLSRNEPDKLIIISKQIAAEGGNFQYVVDELLNYLHQISVNQIITIDKTLISQDPEVNLLATQFSPEDVQLFYQIILKGSKDLDLAPSITIGFEMMLLRLYAFKPDVPKGPIEIGETNTNKAKERIEPAVKPREVGVIQEIDVIQRANTIQNADPIQNADDPIQNADSIQEINIIQEVDVVNDWSAILQKLNLNGLALNAAEHTELIGKTDKFISLRISPRHSSVFTKAVITRIEQGLSNYYKEEIILKLVNDEKIKFTPAQQKSEIQKKANDDAVLALQGDQFFQQLQQEFSAELVRDSIVPLKDEL